MGNLDVILSNVTHPFTRPTRRVRDKGNGHQRRVSETAPLPRSSVYETIQEESSVMISPIAVPVSYAQVKLPECDTVYIVDDTDEVDMEMEWDDDRGISSMRRYCALKDEAQDTVEESRRIWMDTPFSLFDLQCQYDPFFFARVPY